jgi:hypothetical protein
MQVVLWSPIDERHHVAGNAKHDPANGLPAPSGLVICRESDASFFLFQCDADWSPVVDTRHESCDAARAQAEFEFPEAAATWASGASTSLPPSPPAVGNARGQQTSRLSRLSWTGIWLALFSIAPFGLLGATDALGWTGPSTGCGLVALAAIGGPVGVLLWLVGLLVDNQSERDRSNGVDPPSP